MILSGKNKTKLGLFRTNGKGRKPKANWLCCFQKKPLESDNSSYEIIDWGNRIWGSSIKHINMLLYVPELGILNIVSHLRYIYPSFYLNVQLSWNR